MMTFSNVNIRHYNDDISFDKCVSSLNYWYCTLFMRKYWTNCGLKVKMWRIRRAEICLIELTLAPDSLGSPVALLTVRLRDPTWLSLSLSSCLVVGLAWSVEVPVMLRRTSKLRPSSPGNLSSISWVFSLWTVERLTVSLAVRTVNTEVFILQKTRRGVQGWGRLGFLGAWFGLKQSFMDDFLFYWKIGTVPPIKCLFFMQIWRAWYQIFLSSNWLFTCPTL